ncbi:TonB-dependent receptor [Hydrogenimonas thermophila]|nr:TonB-dependent receptor [Hydrogenimonas thermophila]
MKKTPFISMLSMAAVLCLQAQDFDLQAIDVEESANITIVKDVAGEEVRSADLADALYKIDPNIQLIRRSGIANDIILRGLRKDNINVLIDGGKIYGGCPNRMDPPLSHVLASNVKNIIVKEGPYDVENFGTLSGVVNVETLPPSKGFHGEGYLNVGSWGYRKIGAQASGGNDKVRVFVGASTESSGQYEDGDGNTLAEQVDNYAEANPAVAGSKYAPAYHDMKAYDKKSAMVKLYVNVTDNQELKLSYTLNRSSDVLYPNSKMDALKDDSDLFNAKYTIHNLGQYSKELDFEFYNSWVYHPMGTYYRDSVASMGIMENVMNSRIYGGKVKNSMDLAGGTLTYGIDASKRKWNGEYLKNGDPTGVLSINYSETKNSALFTEYDKSFGNLDMQIGLRYDDTSVSNEDPVINSKDYNSFNGYLFGTYTLNNRTKLFAGLGKSSRVPDGKELYFQDKTGLYIGTSDLDQTKNYEADFGVEHNFANLAFKGKFFYSILKDFIAFNSSKTENKYENVDAKLYGLSFDGTYTITENIYTDFGVAYLRGKKDEPLVGQTDTDMPNITPLKGNVAVIYDYDDSLMVKLSMVAASGWNDYDSDNGEQELSGYTVFNFKVKKDVTKHFEVTAGIDNIFDRTYAITNTYADMTLVTGGEPMLLNEPGRYYYCNLKYHF